jgi:hypothetical protein
MIPVVMSKQLRGIGLESESEAWLVLAISYEVRQTDRVRLVVVLVLQMLHMCAHCFKDPEQHFAGPGTYHDGRSCSTHYALDHD